MADTRPALAPARATLMVPFLLGLNHGFALLFTHPEKLLLPKAALAEKERNVGDAGHCPFGPSVAVNHDFTLWTSQYLQRNLGVMVLFLDHRIHAKLDVLVTTQDTGQEDL